MIKTLNLDLARESNSNIVSDKDQEINEHDINAIYLKMLAYGIDTLDGEDSTRISDIAHLCPYIGGTAVYKARTLYAMYEPASMFDDIALCNQIGVYKNGNNGNDTKGIFDDENTYLKSLKPKEVNTGIVFDDFIIFPNPLYSTINIRYKLNNTQNGSLILYDLLGRERIKIDLSNKVTQVSADIHTLEPGVYIYKYCINNAAIHTGKLLKD